MLDDRFFRSTCSASFIESVCECCVAFVVAQRRSLTPRSFCSCPLHFLRKTLFFYAVDLHKHDATHLKKHSERLNWLACGGGRASQFSFVTLQKSRELFLVLDALLCLFSTSVNALKCLSPL